MGIERANKEKRREDVDEASAILEVHLTVENGREQRRRTTRDDNALFRLKKEEERKQIAIE